MALIYCGEGWKENWPSCWFFSTCMLEQEIKRFVFCRVFLVVGNRIQISVQKTDFFAH